jgi:hypothetical protein
MMLFLVNQFTCELQGRADILHGQVIFPLHFLKAHAASKAAYNNGHSCAHTANDRLAMTDSRINCNSVMHRTSQITLRLLDRQPCISALVFR